MTWQVGPSKTEKTPNSAAGEPSIAARLSTLTANPQTPPFCALHGPSRVVSGEIISSPAAEELSVDTRLMQLPKRPSGTTDQVQPVVLTVEYLCPMRALS